MVWTIHEGLDKYRMQWNGLVHNPLQVSQKKQVHDSTMGWITSVDTPEARAGLGKDPRLVYDI